jgi:hypothetical protein
MRLFALVAPAAPDRPLKARHAWGLPPELNDGVDAQVVMPWARVLILEEDRYGYGAMLYRYGGDAFDRFAGDTWAESVEQARAQAQFEYEELLGEWEPIPAEVADATGYAVDHARLRA